MRLGNYDKLLEYFGEYEYLISPFIISKVFNITEVTTTDEIHNNGITDKDIIETIKSEV